MTLLTPPTVSTSYFAYDKEDNLLVAEASDLPVNFGRVWDDACDEGYTIVSKHTGRSVIYVVNEVVTSDGDLLYWDLVPARPAESGLPKVRIFND